MGLHPRPHWGELTAEGGEWRRGEGRTRGRGEEGKGGESGIMVKGGEKGEVGE